MLAVILKILSVIGIVLLCLLGLILAVIILALVLPVRYKIKASMEKETELNAVFKLNYFFHIVRALAFYEKKKVNVTVKILWFKLFSLDFPEETADEEISDEEFDAFLDDEFPEDEPDESENPENAENLTESEDADEPGTQYSEVSDEELHNDLFGEDKEDELSGTAEDESIAGPDEDADDHEDGKSDDNGEDDAPEDFSDRISTLISKIKCKIGSIYDKIRKVRSEIRYYRNILNSNEAAYALRVIKKRLKKIFKIILPRKASCDLVYGFSSPDITGKVFGLYCLIRNRFSKGSNVIPDFENAVFEGYIEAKGHFNFISLLYNAICVVLDKNCRKIYRSLKHHRNKENCESGSVKDDRSSEEAA